ncbi:MAG: type I-E CRISPR-associated endoribonuclease Cas2 [Actinomycetales bacterium]|nr:type I-E CRISPR-associated endoribonuclease Cas2 [Candidatus Lutibacillus vidarii]
MVVLVLTACPAGLRGHLTRWLLEISPGVFVGHVSGRVRDDLWSQVVDLCRDGKALLVYSMRNEQRLAFRAHRHEWVVQDADGLILMERPSSPVEEAGRQPGWSNAAKWRRARRK